MGNDSQHYQNFFKEISMDPMDMDRYIRVPAVSDIEDEELSQRISKCVKEVQTDIIVRLFRLANKHLTAIQKTVFQLKIFGGRSFIDIATIRKEHYSCWESSYTANYYAAHGQKNYSKTRGTYNKHYGGYIKKLSKIASKDREIQDLLKELKILFEDPASSIRLAKHEEQV